MDAAGRKPWRALRDASALTALLRHQPEYAVV
jgi:hypothetical protein